MDDAYLEDDWYRTRRYAHFDRPLSLTQARRLVTCPSRVASHAFWPVVLNPQRVVSLKADREGNRRRSEKRRPIAFAAHSDAHIYAYYGRKLGRQLELIYDVHGGDHVLAYRRFTPPKCNVHFAWYAFKEIAASAPRDFIAMDVEGFFDVLDHALLKKAWCKLLGVERLSEDHYAVFRACTKDSAVTIPMLRDVFGGEVRRRAGKKQAPICAPDEFRRLVKPRLRPRHELVWEIKGKPRPESTTSGPVGIPQGLPISAILANLYMLDADYKINDRIRRLGGSYRRYSDDILLIVPSGKGSEAEHVVTQELEKVKLAVNSEKFDRCRFRPRHGRLCSYSVSERWTENERSPASYLGLSFDGENIWVRSATISRFMIKAGRAVNRAEHAAKRRGHDRIKRRKLYAQLTSLGYGSAYGRAAALGEPPPAAPRIGFFRYLNLVERVTGSATVARQRRQLKNHVFRLINEGDERIKAGGSR